MGVVLYIQNTIHFKLRQYLFKPKAKYILMNTWYRPPNTPVDIFDDFELCILKNGYRNQGDYLFAIVRCLWNDDNRILTN